jgi:hypothetical protein
MNDVERIEWMDHHEPSGPAWWTAEEVDRLGVVFARTVGFVEKETDTYVVVSSSRCEGLVNRPLVIVKSAIVSRTKLKGAR